MNPQKPFPQAGEMFDLQLTFESEVFPALESFVRFGRQRNFHKALEIYSKKLEKHLDDAFLVTIEYADLLFEQGDYGKLSEFLGSRTAAREKAKVGHLVLEQSGADEEDQLLEVMKSLADIFREGALRQALVQARKCKDFLARKYQEGLKYPKKLPTNIQIYIYEIYLRIIVFAFQTSNWVELSDMDPPWSKEILQPSSTPSSEPLQPGSGVLKWFKTLQDNGCLWEASRILRILLPVLPMLPSKDLVLLIFGEQQSLGKASAEDDGSELGESDKWAHVSMNLSKARILLDTIVRENSPSTVSHFSHEILYTMGQGYVKMARMQELGKPNPEVMLEERDYSLIGENIQLSNPSRELQKFQISSKDYKLHALKIGDESVRSKDENHSSNSANWDEAMRQIPLENRLGFVRAWEILATIILSKSIDKPAKSILAGEREAFQASMMATGSPQRKGAGKTRRGEYSPEDTLKDATQTICDYKFAETLSYDQNSMKKNYPMRFDIPLYIKAFIQRREQLSANNLMFLDREDDAIKKIDLQTVQSCLPDFIKNSDQLGTRASDEGEIRIVNIQGSVEVGGDMTISGRVNVFVPGDLLVKGTLNISDGASVHQSTPMVGSANIDAIQNLPEGSERAEYRGIYGLLGRSLNIFWAPTRR